MKPYADIIKNSLTRLSPERFGVAFFLVPPREHRRVADSLLVHFPDARVEVLSEDLVRNGPACCIVLGLPGAQNAAALDTLNGLRSTLITRRRLFLVLVTDREFSWIQRFAGDALSVARMVARVPLVPREVDEQEARRELTAWVRERYGRLNLRGFVRSEQEDVNFSVEDIYQDLEATPWGGGSASFKKVKWTRAPLYTLLSQTLDEPARVAPLHVLLGHPGSGKTFFLRWLALKASGDTLPFLRPGTIPVLLPLSLFQRVDESLFDQIVSFFLEENLKIAHLLRWLAEQGRVLFLLDGVDEVGDSMQRRMLADLLQGMRGAFPGCSLIVTSRIVGYQDAPLDGKIFEIAPLGDGSVRGFLLRWCELYAQEIHGKSKRAQRIGTQEGLSLSRDVLAHPSLLELVRTPLMLTVLALVHRSGIRLPEHRIELYEHAFRVLVERWNRVRGLNPGASSAPMTTADALRLLGPVALHMLERGERVLARADLEILLEGILREQRLRRVASTPGIIELFKTNLGLLVEQGPDTFAFLHLTLAEYLAAKELVRKDRLLELAQDKLKVFRPEWREVVLLGAGELGLVRADDEDLEELVSAVVRSSSKGARPTSRVPWLLAGLLADDPCLSERGADAIVAALIPGWWFEKKYTRGSLEDVVFSALGLLGDRFRTSRHRDRVRNALRSAYRQGIPEPSVRMWVRSGLGHLLVEVYRRLGLDWGVAVLQVLRVMPQPGFQLIPARWIHDPGGGTPPGVFVAFSSFLWSLEPLHRPECVLAMAQDGEPLVPSESVWNLESAQNNESEVWLRVPSSWGDLSEDRWLMFQLSAMGEHHEGSSSPGPPEVLEGDADDG